MKKIILAAIITLSMFSCTKTKTEYVSVSPKTSVVDTFHNVVLTFNIYSDSTRLGSVGSNTTIDTNNSNVYIYIPNFGTTLDYMQITTTNANNVFISCSQPSNVVSINPVTNTPVHCYEVVRISVDNNIVAADSGYKDITLTYNIK